jgi:hypothetical protein
VSVSPASSYSSELDRYASVYPPYGSDTCQPSYELHRPSSTPQQRHQSAPTTTSGAAGWYDAGDVMPGSWPCADVGGRGPVPNQYQPTQPGCELFSVDYGWNTHVDFKPIIASCGLTAYPGKSLSSIHH